MAVTSVQGNVAVTKQANPASSKATLDYDTFLRLLVAQMKNQDPTQPMDSTEYVAQLATFSNVEQLIASNKKLDQLVSESRLEQGANLIGLTVTSEDDGVSGVVESVRITGEGIMAKLSGAGEIEINERVSISK